jgi:hypothetical protein
MATTTVPAIGVDESKLSDIELKNRRKGQVKEIIEKAKSILAEKNRFAEIFSEFHLTLDNFKRDKLQMEKRMLRFIDCLELSVEELQRKEQDFQ